MPHYSSTISVSLPLSAAPGMPIAVVMNPPPADLSAMSLSLSPTDRQAPAVPLALEASPDGGPCIAEVPAASLGMHRWTMRMSSAGGSARVVATAAIEIVDDIAELEALRQSIQMMEAQLTEHADRQAITLPDGRTIQHTPRNVLYILIARYRAVYARRMRALAGRPDWTVSRLR